MQNVTYEQFMAWCKHWGYTEEEGYKAMCFTSNIIGQYFGNCANYVKHVNNDESHSYSKAFKEHVEKKKNDANHLYLLYETLNTAVFDMLEEHEKRL